MAAIGLPAERHHPGGIHLPLPGLGTTLAEAVGNRDIPLIQAVTLIYAAATVIFSLVTDVVSFLLSPRARTAQR